MGKRDYLGECNERQMALDDFQVAFCSRCFQTECTRSMAGKSKFDHRVSTWIERLITETPRLDPQDPRYSALAGQNFLTIDVGRTPEIRSDWVDPLAVRASEPVVVQPPPAAPLVVPPPKEPTPVPQATPAMNPGRIPRHMILANAPDQSGKMLPGAPSPATPQPRRDAWATTEKPDGVVQPGATIKLGGGSGSGV